MGDMQRSGALVAGILVLVVIAAVAAFLLLSGRDGDPPPSASASSSASAVPSGTTPASLAAELIDRPWTVLFIGVDSTEERRASGQPRNADAILLVSVNADGSRVSMVSLPRDTVDVSLPDGGTYPRKVNGLYAEAGPEGLTDAVATLYGVEIDGYLALDMDDFTGLVDAVGGVDVNPPAPLVDPIVDLDLAAGPQEIDAATANGYVRTRVDQDYGRMRRQQEVVVGVVERLLDPATDVDLRAVLDGLGSLETDLPLAELPSLLEVARRAADAPVERLLIEPPLITFEGDRGDGRGYILEPDVEAIRDAVGPLIDSE